MHAVETPHTSKIEITTSVCLRFSFSGLQSLSILYYYFTGYSSGAKNNALVPFPFLKKLKKNKRNSFESFLVSGIVGRLLRIFGFIINFIFISFKKKKKRRRKMKWWSPLKWAHTICLWNVIRSQQLKDSMIIIQELHHHPNWCMVTFHTKIIFIPLFSQLLIQFRLWNVFFHSILKSAFHRFHLFNNNEKNSLLLINCIQFAAVHKSRTCQFNKTTIQFRFFSDDRRRKNSFFFF